MNKILRAVFVWMCLSLITDIGVASYIDVSAMSELNQQATSTYAFIYKNNNLKGRSYPWVGLDSVSERKLKELYQSVYSYMSSHDLNYSIDELQPVRVRMTYHPLLTQILMDLVVIAYPYMPISWGPLLGTHVNSDPAPYNYEEDLLQALYPKLYIDAGQGLPDPDYFKKLRPDWNVVMQKRAFQHRKAALVSLAHLSVPVLSESFSCQSFGLTPSINTKALFATYSYSGYMGNLISRTYMDDGTQSFYPIYYDLKNFMEIRMAAQVSDRCFNRRNVVVYNTKESDEETDFRRDKRRFHLTVAENPLITTIDQAVADLKPVLDYSDRVVRFYE